MRNNTFDSPLKLHPTTKIFFIILEKIICTPAAQAKKTDSKKAQTAKKIASLLRNPSALKPKDRLQSQIKSNKPATSVKRCDIFCVFS